MANDSDSENEREMSYREPTMVERIGPEEARRLLMDDDDDEQIASRRVDDGNFSHIRPHLLHWRVIFFYENDVLKHPNYRGAYKVQLGIEEIGWY